VRTDNDGKMASNDNTDARMEDITLIQLKDKLRRKMKTADVKADLMKGCNDTDGNDVRRKKG